MGTGQREQDKAVREREEGGGGERKRWEGRERERDETRERGRDSGMARTWAFTSA